MQSTSCEILGWDESLAGRNINSIRYSDDITLMAESKEESEEEPLDEGGSGE